MSPADFDSRRFRDVLGHLPTGVTVVTGLDSSGRPHGITIGSFVSVSLDPPLVGFLPTASSRSWQAIASSGSFCVNILGSDQAELCWRFAKEPADGESRFDGLAHTPAGTGSPILPGVVAWIDCTIDRVVDAGDHVFVIGAVQSLAHEPDVDDAMVFFRGKVAGVKTAGA
jgi:flavin reductase (DIM6/NTAB) family NADH-FMN oxidoreductase RutF